MAHGRDANRSPQHSYSRAFSTYIQRVEERLLAAGTTYAVRKQCGHKQQFTKTQARTVAAQITAHNGYPRGLLNAYRCSICRRWHVGKDIYWEAEQHD